MKFKIGDKVKIAEHPTEAGWTSQMRQISTSSIGEISKAQDDSVRVKFPCQTIHWWFNEKDIRFAKKKIG